LEDAVFKKTQSGASRSLLNFPKRQMKKKINIILVVAILLLAAFLRLYKISDYMTFLGDEGRDVLVAKGILEGHLTLLGPRASAGDFFLGPVYYYMIAPFLWLFRFDPVGPAVMVALLSVATTFLVYYIGKKFFDEKAGLFAASLYAVSPLVIRYAHSSWNPDVVPFFSLLFIYILFKAVEMKQVWKYFLFSGILLGILLQLHYITLFLIVVGVLYIFLAGRFLTKNTPVTQIIKQYAYLLGGFLVGFSPFLAFEVRHGFPNMKTIIRFIFGDTLQKGYETSSSYFATITDVFFRVFGRLVFDFPTPDRYERFSPLLLQFWGLIIVVVAFASIAILIRNKNKSVSLLLGLWLVVSILLFGVYKKAIYDYYFTILFPLPALLIGNFISQIYHRGGKKSNRKIWMVVGIVLFLGVFLLNLYNQPFRYVPNRQKDQVKLISEFVIKQTGNKPYNFALISGGNSDHAYRYFFEILGHKPVVIENQINDPKRTSVTDQLLIVCEEVDCKPLGHPLFDVAAFGRAEIVGEWNVSVVKVYKLVPYKDK